MSRQVCEGRALLRVTLAGSLLATLASTPLRGEPFNLTNAVQVRALSPAKAAQHLPVELKGVVLDRADPYEHAVVLADATGGIYLLANKNLFAPFHRGDFLEVKGATDPGQFAPIVRVTAVHKSGQAAIPPPHTVTYHELLTGVLDAQWVELTGVVRRYFSPAPGSDIWRLVLAADGGIIPVRGRSHLDSQVQVDAEVRVKAICFYQFNQKRQMLTPVLSVPADEPVQVLRPAPRHPFNAPVRAANSLLQFSADTPTGHRIHVRGVVTYAQPASLVWIRDRTAGIRIQAAQTEKLKPGDEVDALGFLAYGSYPPMLADAIFRKTRSTRPPAPLLLTNAASAFDHEDDLVGTDATLEEIHPVIDGLAFTFKEGETEFKGLLKVRSKQAVPDWQPGSKVRVAGICRVIYDDPRPTMGIWQPQSFQLLLRSPADLVALQTPSWWTPRHTIYVLAISLGGLLLVSGVMVLLTRRRLHEQAARRGMAEAEFAAILSERNRLAREIHDTLAQGLTATSVQLRLARKYANGTSEKICAHLNNALSLVRESLEEARKSIWNMRAHILETGDLASALKGILTQMADGSEIAAEVNVSGRPRRLAPVVENNILRVGQEAITNATRHSGARQIKVNLEFGEKQFRLRVQDDGRGFDPNGPPGEGGFGLVGMRERAAELNGELTIRSAPGEGAEILLSLPLPAE